MRDFRDFRVWHKSHELTLAVYRATAGFPSEETFGLTSQLRRAASSIPSNIAEGCGRVGDRELARFMEIGMGSASEVEYQLLLAHDLGLLNATDHEELHGRAVEVKKMLSSLIVKLRRDDRFKEQGMDQGG
jgi:four helix bundle protein